MNIENENVITKTDIEREIDMYIAYHIMSNNKRKMLHIPMRRRKDKKKFRTIHRNTFVYEYFD